MFEVLSKPDQNLSLIELGLFAREEVCEYRRWRSKSKQAAYKATLAIFRAGKWLTIAHERLTGEGRGQWTSFLKENDLPRTTAWEAEELYKCAQTEDAIHELTPTQAKRQFAIVRDKQANSSTTTSGIVLAMNQPELSMTYSPNVKLSDPSHECHARVDQLTPHLKGEPPADPIELSSFRDSIKKHRTSTSTETKALSETQPAQKPQQSEVYPILTTIVHIVRRLELMVEDELTKCDLSVEPKEAIRTEIARGIELLRIIEGGIA